MRLFTLTLCGASLLAFSAFAQNLSRRENVLNHTPNGMNHAKGTPATPLIGHKAAANKSAAKRAKIMGTFTLTVGGIENGAEIPETYAYCAPNGKGGTRDGENISPSIQWSPPPAGTQSLALVVVDHDVPASFDKANVPGESIEVKEPRQDFYHWVVLDIPPNVGGILKGKDSNGLVKGGKPYGNTQGYGINGQNDYTLIDNGPHGGWDGPCPPWNDKRMHQYHFTIYALDVRSLKLPTPAKGKQVEAAIQGHVLAKSEVVGNYTTNPDWLQKRNDAGNTENAARPKGNGPRRANRN